jgi:hypothetical protein
MYHTAKNIEDDGWEINYKFSIKSLFIFVENCI